MSTSFGRGLRPSNRRKLPTVPQAVAETFDRFYYLYGERVGRFGGDGRGEACSTAHVSMLTRRAACSGNIQSSSTGCRHRGCPTRAGRAEKRSGAGAGRGGVERSLSAQSCRTIQHTILSQHGNTIMHAYHSMVTHNNGPWVRANVTAVIAGAG